MQPEPLTPSSPFDIRGRCACGRRYRIRNASLGAIVNCPSCNRPIAITSADVKAALADQPLMPVQSDTAELREAILLDFGGLQLAPEGSVPGLTERYAPGNSEATVSGALRGWRPSALSAALSARHAPARPPRPFALDLLASFYCAGVLSNAVNIFVMAIAFCLPMLLLMFLSYGALPLVLILELLVIAYMVQFYWSVMELTCAGEDEIPWIQSGGGIWDGCVMPTIWLAGISLMCSAPYLIGEWFVPSTLPTPLRSVMLLGLLATGWLFWPVAVMSIGISGTWYYARPDWLVRCVLAIGPLYGLACGILATTAVGWLGFWILLGTVYAWLQSLGGWVGVAALIGAGLTLPVLSSAVSLYLGYVLFRTLGLLFRHRREHLPWRF